jgi:hypothetical protein
MEANLDELLDERLESRKLIFIITPAVLGLDSRSLVTISGGLREDSL